MLQYTSSLKCWKRCYSNVDQQLHPMSLREVQSEFRRMIQMRKNKAWPSILLGFANKEVCVVYVGIFCYITYCHQFYGLTEYMTWKRSWQYSPSHTSLCRNSKLKHSRQMATQSASSEQSPPAPEAFCSIAEQLLPLGNLSFCLTKM